MHLFLKKKKKLGGHDSFKTIFYILLTPLYIISKFIPKKHNLIVLGSSMGRSFTDNSKYLFLYLEKQKIPIKYYWITKNKKLYKEKNKDFKNFLYQFDFKGLWILLRARIAVVSHRPDDLFPPIMGGTFILQLWHTIPFKKLGYDLPKWKKKSLAVRLSRLTYKLFPHTSYLHCHKVVVTSENLIKFYCSAFNININKTVILGQPRIDCLADDYTITNRETSDLKILEKYKSYNKVIAWLPTHRGGLTTTFTDLLKNYQFDKEEAENFLVKHKYLLVMKPHYVEFLNAREFLGETKNITVLDEDQDPYILLKYTDILITDYSGVYFDFLAVNKPIIFTTFDYEEFVNEVGFYYDYEKFTPGVKCSNWKEVFKNIDLAAAQDEYRKPRIELNKFINKYQFKNSERVTEYIKELIL